MQTVATIILAILLAPAVGALIVGCVLWRHRQRDEAAERQAQSLGGGGGPKEPA